MSLHPPMSLYPVNVTLPGTEVVVTVRTEAELLDLIDQLSEQQDDTDEAA